MIIKNKVKLTWSAKVEKRITSLNIFYSKSKSKKYKRIIKTKAKIIIDNPEIGMHSRVRGLRKLYISETPFYIVYRLAPNTSKPRTAMIITIINTRHQKEVNSY